MKLTKTDLVGTERTTVALGELVNGQPLYLTTPAGTFAVQERPDGALTITAKEGGLVIQPKVANVIDVGISGP